MYKLTIKVTKEVLQRSMMCGTYNDENKEVSQNCAIALAIRELFPEAHVTSSWIVIPIKDSDTDTIDLPEEASNFIYLFDSLSDTPEQRLNLPEFEFQVEIPDDIIDNIGISQVREILIDSETMTINNCYEEVN